MRMNSPFVMIIFGVTGDLSQRKLLPSLFHLFKKQELPETFFIMGFSRRDYDHQAFREFAKTAVQKAHGTHEFEETAWHEFESKLFYQQGNFDEVQGYQSLIEKLEHFDKELMACVPRFFYLSTPPDQYGMILEKLDETKLSEGCGHNSDKWTKILVEKPFGRGLTESQALEQKLTHIFKEEQIYRIDHYLGKETVQNILAFRFANPIFAPVWNKHFIDHVQITISETVGIEARGNFYEGVGALRDMAQSHLLELMTSVTMKQPQRYDAASMRQARSQSIKQIRCIDPKMVGEFTVRGQYGSGVIKRSSGETYEVPGYRQEPNVVPTSNTETFVALKLFTQDPEWFDVPFYLRTGKRLSQKATEISVIFKQLPFQMFADTPQHMQLSSNILTFRIQPNEGISLQLNAKKIGFDHMFEQRDMAFSYTPAEQLADAYEKLLLDALKGDQMLFTSTDEVSSSWQLISKIAEGWWAHGDPHFPNYEAGSWGPEEAKKLIEQDGRSWVLR